MDDPSTKPPAGIMITPMHADHLDALADLESMAFSIPWSYDALAEDVDAESAVGYIGMHHILDEGAVTNIVVHPACRRQGIAACLMQEVIRYAEEHDISRIVLEVRPSNEAAIALYEKFGFELDGRRPGFYDSPKEDALLYSLKL